MWADSIPKLLQARLIESFENYDIAHAPLRNADVGQAEFQLLIDVRRFRIAMESEPAAEIGLSARIVDKNGKVVASRLFEESQKFDKLDPPAAVAAFDDGVRPNGEGHDRLDRAGAVGGGSQRPRTAALFQGLQIRQQVMDLVGIELELRHGRMTGGDAFGQRLCRASRSGSADAGCGTAARS